MLNLSGSNKPKPVTVAGRLAEPLSHTGGSRHARILVVDDEQLIRWSLTARLQDEG